MSGTSVHFCPHRDCKIRFPHLAIVARYISNIKDRELPPSIKYTDNFPFTLTSHNRTNAEQYLPKLASDSSHCLPLWALLGSEVVGVANWATLGTYQPWPWSTMDDLQEILQQNVWTGRRNEKVFTAVYLLANLETNLRNGCWQTSINSQKSVSWLLADVGQMN